MKQLLIGIFLSSPFWVSSQLIESEEYDYSTEWIWGVSKNTNGGLIGGLMLRYARSVGNKQTETFGLELSNIKHPSEARYVGPNGTGFTFGKANHFYAIRLQYGREKRLYEKANQQGVQISGAVATGPTLGIEAPYYVSVGDGRYEHFDIQKHSTPLSIYGSGRLFQGIGDSKLAIGLNAKASFIFEFGTYRKNVAGIEAGILGEIVSKRINIMPTQTNKFVYTSFFFTLFWGIRK